MTYMVEKANENLTLQVQYCKKRPVKVILKSLDDKDKIMSNLNKLRNADTVLCGISVCEDYTQEEQKQRTRRPEEEQGGKCFLLESLGNTKRWVEGGEVTAPN